MMELLNSAKIQTPAYVYSEKDLISNLELGKSISDEMKCEFLYSMKSLGYFRTEESRLHPSLEVLLDATVQLESLGHLASGGPGLLLCPRCGIQCQTEELV